MDFNNMLVSLNDSSAAGFKTTADKISSAIQNKMFINNIFSGKTQLNTAGFAYYWGNRVSYTAFPEPLHSPLKFYPDGVTQIFAQAYRLDLPVSQYDAGWNFLNTYFPKYKTYEYDSDPWTLIGLAAAQNGNRVLAEDMQIKTVSGHNAGKAIPINNWSFYRRISLQLQKGINY